MVIKAVFINLRFFCIVRAKIMKASKNRIIMRKITFIFLLGGLSFLQMFAQNKMICDNAVETNWDSALRNVEIPSVKDGTIRRALMYKTICKSPQPLVVNLDTWNHDSVQKNPLIKEIIARGWNYIHPNLEEVNQEVSVVSILEMLAHIEDAIRYALRQTNANPNDVHIIGSGKGGVATLASYMNLNYPVKSFSVWGALNVDLSLEHQCLIEKRKDARLFIYAKMNGGDKDSLSVTPSLNIYNRLVGELKYGILNMDDIKMKAVNDPSLISCYEIFDLLGERSNFDCKKNRRMFGCDVYLIRKYSNIQLTVLESDYDQIPQALGLIPYNKITDLKYNILTIGDSNGQKKDGWVAQLKKMLPESTIINYSEAGRTIGFDNNGKERLNGLKNINSYLDQAQVEKKKYDYIILCLGTNDTKRIFEARQNEVVLNFEKLLNKIKMHNLYKGSDTKLIFVTPPPLREKNISLKFQGASQRLNNLIPELMYMASKKGFSVVDVYHPLLGILDYYAGDGVHMAGAGQEIVASKIICTIMDK